MKTCLLRRAHTFPAIDDDRAFAFALWGDGVGDAATPRRAFVHPESSECFKARRGDEFD